MGIQDDELDGMLGRAFGAPARPGRSVLDTIQRLHGAGESVLLREAHGDDSPVLVRRKGPGAIEGDSRYQILGEIARGGIGVVYKGRDRDLNRDIALKVLRPEYAQREDVVQRFVEEAQVAGQLQHPGIVPVYGLGLQEDGRPSFAMKLIKGQTLAELLDSNPGGLDLLAIFEQVAQTMAYAHSRGVIHRDLKPANIMVGAFGEVQVVDWGFAKVLGQEDIQPAADRTVIATLRSGPVGSQSIAGSVMGTPAYMPPEQAMGQIEELDERSDAFALGAILCELLTGQPPYTGEPKDQLIAAAQSRLDEAHERLLAAEAADELKQLVRDCLEPMPSKRPRNARIVAERLSTHLSGAEERARQAELDAVTAETAAIGAAWARRRALMRAAVALCVILAGGGGYFVWKRGRDARSARAAPRIAEALRAAHRHEGEHDWPRAVAAAQRAVDAAASEGVDDQGAHEVLARVRREQREVEEAERIRAEDDAFLADLEEIRGRLGATAVDVYAASSVPGLRRSMGTAAGVPLAQEHRHIDAAYTTAFGSRFGSVGASVERLRRSRHAVALAANLDLWAWLRRTREALRGADWKALQAAANELDPESRDVRNAVLDEDEAALLRIAGRPPEQTPPALAARVGRVLHDLGRGEEALRLLKAASRPHPDDFWLHMRLGLVASREEDQQLAVRHHAAAAALRPRHASAWTLLGRALRRTGDAEGARAAFERAVSLAPESVMPLNQLGALLDSDLGRHDEALALFRRAVALAPDFLLAQTNIAVALSNMGDIDGAIAHARDLISRHPEYAGGHEALGLALGAKGDWEGALASHRTAVELDPTLLHAWMNVHIWLRHLGRLDEALDAVRKALALDPKNAQIHQALASVLRQKGDLDAALSAAKRAVELDPKYFWGWRILGVVHIDRGELDMAFPAIRKALKLEPEQHFAWADLGVAHGEAGNLEEALRAHRKVVELAPEHADSWFKLGTALFKLRRATEALPHLQRAVEMEPQFAEGWCNVGHCLRMLGRWIEAVDAFRRGHELGSARPDWGWESDQWLATAERMAAFQRAFLAMNEQQEPARALRLYREALATHAEFAQDPRTWQRYNAACAASLAGKASHAEALAWLRADLDAWSKMLGREPQTVVSAMVHWKEDPGLAAVRDAQDRSEDWTKLWADVDALLKRAQGAAK